MISIIIPVYNTEPFLKRCINSILNQSFRDYQLLLVNDGSTDNSLAICNEFASSDSRITVIDSVNKGSSSARNLGLDKATGDWIIHFDSDDWLEPDMLQILYNKAIETNSDIVACGYYLDDGMGSKNVRLYPYDKTEKRNDIYRVDSLFSAVWNKLVKKELYDKYHIRFVEGVTMWDDLVVTTRLRYHSEKTTIVNKPLYHYFCAPRGNICALNNGKYPHSQLSVVDFLEKYFESINQNNSVVQKILASAKITAKKSLLFTGQKNDFLSWKSLYPSASKSIVFLKHLPFKARIWMVIASLVNFPFFVRIKHFSARLKQLFIIHNVKR